MSVADMKYSDPDDVIRLRTVALLQEAVIKAKNAQIVELEIRLILRDMRINRLKEKVAYFD